MAFNLRYVYHCITILRGKQAEVLLNHEAKYVCRIRQSLAVHRECRILKLGGGQA
jgi:hypothetical protein